MRSAASAQSIPWFVGPSRASRAMRPPAVGYPARSSHYRTEEEKTLIDVSTREGSRSVYAAGNGGGLVCSLRNGHGG